MADEVKPAPAAPTPAPAPAPLTPQQQAVSSANVAQKEAEQAKGANPTVKRDTRPASPIVTNPPVPEAPPKEPDPDTLQVSPSTRAEMDAGKKALEASKPKV